MVFVKARFVELARRMAERSPHLTFPVGAVVVRRNQVVSLGMNRGNKTHPKSSTPWKSIHAEHDALMHVPLELTAGGTIYVVRLTKRSDRALSLLATSRPCNYCQKLLRERGIERMIYVDRNREIVGEDLG